MVHAQVEDQQVSSLVSHQAVQLETAKSLYKNNPKGNLGVICLTWCLNAETTNLINAGGFCLKL